jgi:hypothetical protein
MAARIGVLLTLAFFCFWAGLVYSRFSDFAALSLNELGDFLSGTVGSVALLWLVLGYFQQGKELKNSNGALMMQAIELKNSVEQQRELVEVSKQAIEVEKIRVKQLEAQRSLDLEPTFVWQFGLNDFQDGASFSYRLKIHLSGRSVKEVKIAISLNGKNFYHDELGVLVNGWILENDTAIKLPDGRKIEEAVTGSLNYVREDGSHGEQVFELSPPKPNEDEKGFFEFRRRD